MAGEAVKKCRRCGKKAGKKGGKLDSWGRYQPNTIVIENGLCQYCRAADTRHKKAVKFLRE